MAQGLYIHVPFCDHICNYCDFPKLYAHDGLQDQYLDALLGELQRYETTVGFAQLKTLYIGGGTPTALSLDQLRLLLSWLSEAVDLEGLIEFTMEANPENLTDEKVDLLLEFGVTRVSLGVQTFHDGLLQSIGRTHSGASAIKAVEKLKAKGMPRINLDLIYGMPGQTMEELEADLKTALALEIDHLSAYSLILEEHTKLYVDYLQDKVELSENELEAAMFVRVIDTLTAAGYEHYEISNFTKGEPSHHNLLYWSNVSYIGCGLGAHGYVDGVRYSNTRSINSYIRSVEQGKLPVTESSELVLNQQIEEELFLGLRLLKGVDLAVSGAKFETDLEGLYQEALARMEKKKYLIREGSRVRLSREGLLMANEVFEQFLLT